MFGVRERLSSIYIILAVFASLSHAESDVSFSGPDLVSESVFPRSEMLRKFAPPSPHQVRAIGVIRRSVVEQMKRVAPDWSVPVAGRVLTSSESNGLFRSFLGSAVYLCRDATCSGCRNKLGCARVESKMGSVGTVILLNLCLLSSAPRACQSIDPAYAQPNVRLLYSVLQEAIVAIAYASSNFGERIDKKAFEKISTARERVESSLGALWRLIERCPGPLPDSGRAYLEASGFLHSTNEFWEQCGGRMLQAVRGLPLIRECSRLIDLARWKKDEKQGWLSTAVQVRRCEEFCEVATCAPRPEPVTRFIRFDSSYVLSLPEAACEGAVPIRSREMVEGVLDQYRKEGGARRGSLSAARELCLDKMGLAPPRQEMTPGIELDLLQ